MTFDFLASMSLADREELAAQLAFELRKTKTPVSAADAELWDALGDVLRAHGKGRQPLSTFITDFGRAKYASCVEQIETLLVEAAPPGVRKTVVMALRRIVLECLAQHLKAASIPVTPRVMLNSFGLLRYAVDQQFPGYIAAQLLHRVATLRQAA